jgi:toxin-antitoxin system PIN domain toxin
MSSLSFPDVNVWLALASHEHVHSAVAREWWNSHEGGMAFCRISQIGLLRLLTTAAVMGNKPLSLDRSWQIYDELLADDRVVFVYERPEVDAAFRARTAGRAASPKLWADAWMLAMAGAAGGVLVTFDMALGSRGAHCLLSQGRA